nr:acyl-UDP-N-acetylglucosamine o-acyltransferase [Cavernulicola chilensis]
MRRVHPSAIIHSSAIIGQYVVIGPYSIIGAKVKIGDYTTLGPNVIVDSNTIIGKWNKIFAGGLIGLAPQDLKYKNIDKGVTYIGHGNIIREYVTVHCPTKSTGITAIGNNNLLMAHVHIAHDCCIHNKIVIANNAVLAGHVKIENQAVIGGMIGVHQFVQIGKLSMVGAMSKIDRDVPPYLIVSGNPARIKALNWVGLKRANFVKTEIEILKNVFNLFYRNQLSIDQALNSDKLKAIEAKSICVKNFKNFIYTSNLNIENGRRGVTSYREL